jgi:hypothetical protein
MERVGEVLSTKGNSVSPKVGAVEGEDDTTVEIVWKVVVAEGEAVTNVGKVVTSTPELPGACGAGAAVKTTTLALLPTGGEALGEAAGDDAGVGPGASVVKFTEGERFGEAKGFVEG